MRKMLAGFLATSMIVAVASSVTFAANQAAWAEFDFNATTAVGTPAIAKDPKDNNPGPASVQFSVDTTFSGAGLTSYNQKGSVSYEITTELNGATLTVWNGTNEMGSVSLNNVAAKTISSVGGIALSNATAAGRGNASAIAAAPTPADITDTDIVEVLRNATFSGLEINGKRYSGKLAAASLSGNDIRVIFDQAAEIKDATRITLDLDVAQSVSTEAMGYKIANLGTDYTPRVTLGSVSISATATAGNLNIGSGNITANVTGNLNVADVIVCDGEGNPIPLTEDPSGVDQAINDNDGVQSGATVYFMIKEQKTDGTKSFYDDDNYYKIRVNKGDNAKMVNSLDVVYKNFSHDLYDVIQGTDNVQVPNTSGRHRFIKMELNPNYTTDEFKITLDMRMTPTSDAIDKNIANSDEELKIKDFSFYMKNIERAADNDWRVGINGLMLKPLENDWNDVTWFDEDGDVAHMKFFADSDIDSFFSKLSTKWLHADYASYFNDQDAFIFNFTGSPKLSSTSRADLEIYNPFVDEDGNETIDPFTAVIYQIIDGDLFDVTDSFQYKEADSGEMAFCTRTRFLGTYVICEKAVEQAVSDETVPDSELTPDDNAGAPEETTPDNNGGGKAPANTGKYL